MLSENEVKLLHHIDTLTTAIEDVMAILEYDRIAPVDVNRAYRLLALAMGDVWENDADSVEDQLNDED